MVITYLEHSGFLLEVDQCIIVFDFYKGVDDLPESILKETEKTVYFLVSHTHYDHYNPEILKWLNPKRDTIYVMSADFHETLQDTQRNMFFLAKGDEYEDSILQIKAFGSTDEGISFLITLNGKKIFHAGDLNNWHWNEESTPEESAQWEKNYLTELNQIARYCRKMDVVLFPIDPRLGKDYMKGAMQFLERIKVHTFIPMHFWGDFQKANEFAVYARRKGCRFEAIEKKGQLISLLTF